MTRTGGFLTLILLYLDLVCGQQGARHDRPAPDATPKSLTFAQSGIPALATSTSPHNTLLGMGVVHETIGAAQGLYVKTPLAEF